MLLLLFFAPHSIFKSPETPQPPPVSLYRRRRAEKRCPLRGLRRDGASPFFVTLARAGGGVGWGGRGGDPADTRVIFDANLPQREYQIHFQPLTDAAAAAAAAAFFSSLFFFLPPPPPRPPPSLPPHSEPLSCLARLCDVRGVVGLPPLSL